MEIIRDPKLIREDYKVIDSLIEFELNQLESEVFQIEDTAVTALIGSYGSGKSTALYNLQNKDKDKDHIWFQFDAWRYPERKGLWDGLIIELAKQIGTSKKTLRKVDGNKSLLGKWGGNT